MVWGIRYLITLDKNSHGAHFTLYVLLYIYKNNILYTIHKKHVQKFLYIFILYETDNMLYQYVLKREETFQ